MSLPNHLAGGLPAAKRLGKHRASRPSDLNGFAKKSTLFRRRTLIKNIVYLSKKDALKFINRSETKMFRLMIGRMFSETKMFKQKMKVHFRP